MKLLILSIIISLNTFGYSHKRGPMVVGDKKKPEASAVLEVASTAKGFLPPRMTQIQRDAIASPTAGLEIYNTDTNAPEFYNGVTWVQSGGTGTSFQFTSTAHGRAIGCPLTPVYFDGTTWTDARADATSTLATHVITKVVDVDTLEISQSGRFSCNGHGLTAGSHYYTGVTGGLSTLPAPSFNNPILLVENTNMVHIMPYRASTTAATTVGQVDTVFGRTGNVVATAGDYGASLITFTPAGTITSTDVQAAINELDSDIQAIDFSGKVDSTRQILTEEGLQGGGDLSSDRSISLDVDGLTTQAIGLSDTIPFYDGTNHRKTTLSQLFTNFVTDLNSLSDVNTAGASIGSILEFDGTNWTVGAKTIDTDNQNAGEVAFAPFSFYTSTDVQNVIPEIESSLRTDINAKAEQTRQIIAGTHLSGGGDLTADRTLSVTPSTINIGDLANFDANRYVDHSTINIDVSASNDGIQITNTNADGSIDEDVQLAIDIPSLDLESPARASTQILGFSVSTNKLVKARVQDIADAAAAAIVAPVDEVNGQTGIVNLDTDDIPETVNRVYVTPAQRDQITNNQNDIATNTGNIATNTTGVSNNNSAISVNTSDITTNSNNISSNDTDIAALQSSFAGLDPVAFSGDYNDLNNLPTLGTAASTDATDYATAAQGALADTALQSGDNVSELVNDAGYITGASIPVSSVNGETGAVVLDADDINDDTTAHKFVSTAQRDQIGTNQSDIAANAGNISSNDTDIANNAAAIATNAGNITTNSNNISSNDTDIAANTAAINSNDTDIANINTAQGVQDTNITNNANAIAALATVASTGDYNDLINLPTLGTAADNDETDFATAAQGALADSALQSGDNVSELVNDANYITSAGAPVQSVNGQTGTVVLDADDIDDAVTTNKFATQTQLDQIATNQGDIATNSTDIATNATSIATNTSAINSNDTDIANNAANISSNDTDIANNLAAINTNVTGIATNASNISANTTAIANLDTDDVAEATNLYFTDARARTAAVVNSTSGTQTDQAPSVQSVNTLVTERIHQASNADATTDLNANNLQFTIAIPVWGNNTNINDDGSFTAVANGVQVNFTGVVEINANILLFSVGTRPAVQMRARLNGTPEGPIAATGYIRQTSGHQQSSLHLNGYYMSVSNGDVISLGSRRSGTTTTAVTMSLLDSSFVSVRRVK